MDLKNVPDFLDSGIAGIVNKRLEAQGNKLAWHFGQTLRNSFPFAKEFLELASFDLAAQSATVEVSTDAIVLTLALSTRFARKAG